MTADTLWDFATACYRRRGVAECCLHLQDSVGADVNMLLTAVWLAAQGRCWQRDRVRELIASCANWREHCILPLRAVRCHLKDCGAEQALYAQAKALELEAEKRQLQLIEAALQPIASTTHEASGDAVAANLHTYFDCLAPTQRPDAALRALREALRD